MHDVRLMALGAACGAIGALIGVGLALELLARFPCHPPPGPVFTP